MSLGSISSEKRPNNVLVLTLPARRSVGIIARCYGCVVAETPYFRSKRGRAAQHRR